MKKTKLILICGLLFLVVSCLPDGADFPNFSLPVYPDAINQKTHFNNPAKGTKAATYQVSAVFPARSLTDFFNEEMINRGFTPYNNPLLALKEFKWNTFNYRTGDWEVTSSPPARYSAKWSNEKEDQFVWLSIDFKDTDGSNKVGTAFVRIHVARYSAYLADMEEIKKITHNQEDTPGRKDDR